MRHNYCNLPPPLNASFFRKKMKIHVVDEDESGFDMENVGEVGDIIHHRTCNQEGNKYYRIVLREGVRELVEEFEFGEEKQVRKKTKHIKPKKIVVKAKRDKNIMVK